MKKLLALLMAVVMLLSLAACKSDDSEDGKKLSKEEKFLQKLEDRLDEIVDAMEDGDEEKAQQLYKDLQELEEEYNKILEELKEEDEEKAEKFQEDFKKLEEEFYGKMEGFEFGEESEIPPSDDGKVPGKPSVEVEEHIQPSEPAEEEQPTRPEIPDFEEVVLVDNEECVVKITDIIDDGYGFRLKVYLENKSADKTYSFSAGNATINGVMTDASMSYDVMPGKKAKAEITFSGEIENYDIGAYTDVEIMLIVMDALDWDAGPIVKETFHIYPYGEDQATAYVRTPQSTDITVVDNEYVTVIATGWEKDVDQNYVLEFYIVNKSDVVIMVSGSSFSVNDYMMDAYLYTGLLQGTSAYNRVYWYEEDMLANDQTSIETVQFDLVVCDNAHYYDDDVVYFVEETVTLTF